MITKIIQLKDEVLHNALTQINATKSLEKYMFSTIPIEDCPYVNGAFYFRVSKCSFEALPTKCDVTPLHIYLQKLIEFRSICEKNNDVEYYIILK